MPSCLVQVAAKREKEAELSDELSKLQIDLFEQSSNWSCCNNAALTDAAQLFKKVTALAKRVTGNKSLSGSMDDLQRQLQDCSLCCRFATLARIHAQHFSSPLPNCAAGCCAFNVPEGSMVRAHWLRQGGAAGGPCSCIARGASL